MIHREARLNHTLIYDILIQNWSQKGILQPQNIEKGDLLGQIPTVLIQACLEEKSLLGDFTYYRPWNEVAPSQYLHSHWTVLVFSNLQILSCLRTFVETFPFAQNAPITHAFSHWLTHPSGFSLNIPLTFSQSIVILLLCILMAPVLFPLQHLSHYVFT